MANATIPALKGEGLHVVPGFARLPDGTEDPEWRKRYFTWHTAVHQWRIWAKGEFVNNHDFARTILAFCKKDAALFSLLFLVVEEPRAMTFYDQEGFTLDEAYAMLHSDSDDIGVDDYAYQTIHPFIPFAYQVEAMKLCTRVILGPMRTFNHDILWDKARGVGMSYAILAWAYWGWLWVPGLRGTILTEKWDKAERTKDINSLFGKFDLFLDNTPDALIPKGFKWRGDKDADRLLGRLINPATGAAIYTEPTTADATRSGREAYVAVDEMNFHQYLKDTWATIHGTAKHCLGWTTASRRYGRQGETIIEEGKKYPKSATVVTLDWWVNPHQDHLWYEQERERFRAAGMLEQFEVEYLRNAVAGQGRMVYLEQLALTTWTDHGYDPNLPLKLSVDPGISDFTAFVLLQTYFKDEHKRFRWLDAIQLRNLPVQFWVHVMTGIEPRGPWTDAHGLTHPPDDMWRYKAEGFFDLPGVQRVMQFMRTVPPSSIHLYGDPSMRSRDLRHDSWEKVFAKETRALRTREYGEDDPRAVGIMVKHPWEPLYAKNNYQDRRIGLREALMTSEFYSGNDGAHELYDAMQNTMFQKTTETSTRAPGHLHTDEYHQVSAAEFVSTWETLNITPQVLESIRQIDLLPQIKQQRRNRHVRQPTHWKSTRNSLPAGVL